MLISAVRILAELCKHCMAGRLLECPASFFSTIFFFFSVHKSPSRAFAYFGFLKNIIWNHNQSSHYYVTPTLTTCFAISVFIFLIRHRIDNTGGFKESVLHNLDHNSSVNHTVLENLRSILFWIFAVFSCHCKNDNFFFNFPTDPFQLRLPNKRAFVLFLKHCWKLTNS